MRMLENSELVRVHGGLQRSPQMSPESAFPPDHDQLPLPPGSWTDFGSSSSGGDTGNFQIPISGPGPLACTYLPNLPSCNGQSYGFAISTDGAFGLYVKNATGTGTFLGEFTHDVGDNGWNIGLEDTINDVHVSFTIGGAGGQPNSFMVQGTVTW